MATGFEANGFKMMQGEFKAKSAPKGASDKTQPIEKQTFSKTASAGPTTDEFKKLGRNVARAKNQGN